MTIEIFISSAIVSAVITVVGNIVAAKISQKTAVKAARETASSEVEKMQLTWEREDVVASDDEFAEMAGEVARFINCGSRDSFNQVYFKVAVVRSKESGELGKLLDKLYVALEDNDTVTADRLLTQVIEHRRNLKTSTVAEHEG